MDDSKNADNLIRHNDKPWLKTYDRLGLNYNINLPSNNTSLIDVFEQNLNKYVTVPPMCVWGRNCLLLMWMSTVDKLPYICNRWV